MAGATESRSSGQAVLVETTATVLSSEYHYAKWWNLGEAVDRDESYFLTEFSYVVDGTMYFGKSEQWGCCAVGENFPISYNPNDPSENSTTIHKKTVGRWLLVWGFGLLVTILFIYLQQRFNLPDLPEGD